MYMNRFTLALGTLACAALAGAPAALAQAQQACGPRQQIVTKLGQDFKEKQQAVGFVNDKAVLEVYVSDAGTWTIIASGTDGNSCVLSVGKDWDSKDFIKGLDTGLRKPALPENLAGKPNQS
jgi:hypothetical protein